MTVSPRDYFRGRRVLLTGASGGIGSCLARDLAGFAAKVVLVARGADKLESLAKEVRERGGEAFCLPADLVTANAVDVVGKAIDLAGGIDFLVNGAAFFDLDRFENLRAERISQTVHLNLTQPMLLTRALESHWKKQGFGHAIHIASLAGIQPLPFYQVYTATKHGLVGFARSLDLEWQGTGLKVTVIMPSGVDTPMVKHLASLAQATGMKYLSPESVSASALSAAARGRLLVPLGFIETLGIYLGQVFPFMSRPVLLKVKRSIERHYLDLR